MRVKCDYCINSYEEEKYKIKKICNSCLQYWKRKAERKLKELKDYLADQCSPFIFDERFLKILRKNGEFVGLFIELLKRIDRERRFNEDENKM